MNGIIKETPKSSLALCLPCETTSLQCRRGSSPDPGLPDTLISGFQPPQLQENKILLFKPPVLWYFVMATLADEYSKKAA